MQGSIPVLEGGEVHVQGGGSSVRMPPPHLQGHEVCMPPTSRNTSWLAASSKSPDRMRTSRWPQLASRDSSSRAESEPGWEGE